MARFMPKSPHPGLLDLVTEGEGLHIEFKRLVHSAPKIARSIAAFANTEGGIILIGVDDDKRIVGIRSEKEMLQVIDEALRFHIEPKPNIKVRFEEFKHRMVMLVEIPASPDRPHVHIEEIFSRDTGKRTVDRRVFIRSGSHNRAASDDRIALMHSVKKPVRFSFTDRERRLLEYLHDHEQITADEFAETVGIPTSEARRILIGLVRAGALRLITDGHESAYTLTAD